MPTLGGWVRIPSKPLKWYARLWFSLRWWIRTKILRRHTIASWTFHAAVYDGAERRIYIDGGRIKET